ncbi:MULTISPECIES: twin-arginine translocase subunit TatC [unclassified Microbacterium]|uniref:twin-arginine translocase subunit TatC n=1 Tax=unclassified Microbacterium TaxID=2609290 RepID=UPI0030198E5E
MTTVTGAVPERGTMPLASHLREARTRSIRAAIALVIGVVVGWLLSEQVLEQIAQTRNASLNYDSVTGAFDLRLKIALLTGIVISSPVWLFETLRYLAPGLTRRERRFTFGYVLVAVTLFLAGAGFGFALFPHMVELLASFASDQDSTILTASTYVDFVLKTIVATGIAFVLPVLIVLLNALGIVSAATLRRGWRLMVVAIVLFSAMVTPAADVLSMFLVALPMAALFGSALLIAHVHDRRRERRGAPSTASMRRRRARSDH